MASYGYVEVTCNKADFNRVWGVPLEGFDNDGDCTILDEPTEVSVCASFDVCRWYDITSNIEREKIPCYGRVTDGDDSWLFVCDGVSHVEIPCDSEGELIVRWINGGPDERGVGAIELYETVSRSAHDRVYGEGD
jgi:hypothetical protein